MENFIKEAKYDFALNRMNSTRYWANASELQQIFLAYNLNNWIRRLTFPECYESDKIFTIRNRLVKIAARMVRTGRYLYFKLASNCPYKKHIWSVLENIQRLEFFLVKSERLEKLLSQKVSQQDIPSNFTVILE